MNVRFERIGTILIAELEGELDHHSAACIRTQIDQALEPLCAGNLILSFRGVTFMDSAGIGVVAGRYKKVKARFGKMAVTECSRYTHRILNMAGIFTLVPYFEQRETAMKEMGAVRQQISEKGGKQKNV